MHEWTDRQLDLERALEAAGFAPFSDPLWADADHAIGALPAHGHLVLGWLDTTWDGPATPLPLLCDAVHLPGGQLTNDLEQHVTRLRGVRESALITCRFCAILAVPGNTTNGACHGCASSELGIVF